MISFKKFSAVMLAGAMALSLAACGGSSSAAPSAAEAETGAAEAAAPTGDNVIKLGGIGPTTGPAAIYGNACKYGAQIAVDEINALGGDVQFELKFEDDEHDPEKSVNAYNTLKDWGMQALVGTTTTSPCIAVGSESNADRIFELTPSASAVEVVDGKDNVFQMCFTDPNQGSASAEYISSKALGTKIAVIYNNSDAYSTGIYEKFKSAAAELNLEIVSTTTFTDDTAQDFKVQIDDAKNNGADLVFLPIYYQPASLILAQAAQVDYAPVFFGVDGMDGILTLEGFDTSLAEGVMLLTPFVATAEDEATKSFVEKYEAAAGDIPNQFAADAYDCVYAIYNACVEQGITADMATDEICDKLIATFTSGDFKVSGLTGADMTWAESGEITKLPKGMIIKDGVYQPLD